MGVLKLDLDAYYYCRQSHRQQNRKLDILIILTDLFKVVLDYLLVIRTFVRL